MEYHLDDPIWFPKTILTEAAFPIHFRNLYEIQFCDINLIVSRGLFMTWFKRAESGAFGTLLEHGNKHGGKSDKAIQSHLGEWTRNVCLHRSCVKCLPVTRLRCRQWCLNYCDLCIRSHMADDLIPEFFHSLNDGGFDHLTRNWKNDS